MSRPYATLSIYTLGFCLSHIINSRVKQQQASSQNLVWHQHDVRCQLPCLGDRYLPCLGDSWTENAPLSSWQPIKAVCPLFGVPVAALKPTVP